MRATRSPRNVVEGARDIRRPPVDFVERRREPFQAIEEKPNLRHVAAEQPMNRIHLLRGGQPVVEDATDVTPKTGVRIRVGQAAGQRQRASGEVSENLRTRPAACDFPHAPRAKIAIQIRRRRGPERRHRGKPVDRRNVPENLPHAIAAAVRIPGAPRCAIAAPRLRQSVRIARVCERSRAVRCAVSVD